MLTHQDYNIDGDLLWINRIDQYIANHLNDQTISNQNLAAVFNISERQLSRKVKTISGLSPKKYVQQYKMNVAMNYLKTGKFKTVKDTAKAVGIVNTSYFISQFEKKYDKTPFKVLKDFGWR